MVRPRASATETGSAPLARPSTPMARARNAFRGPRVARRNRRHRERRPIPRRLDHARAQQVVEMDDAARTAGAVGQDEERGDGVTFHHGDRLGGERAGTDRLGSGRHQVAGGEEADVGRAFEPAAEIPVGDHADERPAGADDGRDPQPLRGDLDERLLQRRLFGHERELRAGVHHVLHPEEPPTDRAGRVEKREILGGEPSLLEQRDRERVAEGHRRGRARGGREPERTRLLGHAHIEDDVRGLGEARGRVPADGDERETEPPCRGQERQHLLTLPAVRDRQEQVATHERADVTVAALAGVEEEGGCPRAGERRGHLPADDPRLADAGDDHLPATGEQVVERARECLVEAVAERAQRRPLDVEHAMGAGEPLAGEGVSPPPLHVRVPRSARSMATSSRSNVGSAASGRLVAPSESARLGSSWTSINTASTPAATAARASGATNRRSPPDALPSPPGCSTLSVASKTTGHPVCARTGRARMSETRLLYPKLNPLSVTRMSRFPVERAFRTTSAISSGERNCPFFRLTGRRAAATARMKSVCRQRKAGVWSTSATSAAAAICVRSWTSVSTGSPVSRRTSARILNPSSIPGPRKASTAVRFALSKEDL